jgi:hypothetical protein
MRVEDTVHRSLVRKEPVVKTTALALMFLLLLTFASTAAQIQSGDPPAVDSTEGGDLEVPADQTVNRDRDGLDRADTDATPTDSAGGDAGASTSNSTAAPPVSAITTLFHWHSPGRGGWSLGWLYALLGLVGALVTMFSSIGGAVPGTAGQAKIDADEKRLQLYNEDLRKLTLDPQTDSKRIDAVNEVVDRLRDDLHAERWRQFGIALLFYTFLGAFFAMALAQDLLQALVIGAGWTGYMGSFGLKRDAQERKNVKNEVIAEVQTLVDGLEESGHKIRRFETSVDSETGQVSPERLAELSHALKVAKAL